MDDNEVWKTKDEEIATVVELYFRKLFTSRQPSKKELDFVLECVEPHVLCEMNDILCHRFMEGDVKNAFFSDGPH